MLEEMMLLELVPSMQNFATLWADEGPGTLTLPFVPHKAGTQRECLQAFVTGWCWL